MDFLAVGTAQSDEREREKSVLLTGVIGKLQLRQVDEDR
jgi:hypothetical protein